MVLGEIGYYWGHRWSHEIPFLWRFHSIHHSAEAVDFMVSTRGHPIDVVFGRICALIPVFVVGLAGTDGSIKAEEIPFTVSLFGSVWGYFVHANLKWRFGPLEWIVSTPGFHHWHHTKSGPINHNYASVFPWLDRLFGTHHLPREFPADYGIQATVPDSLIGQLVYPLSPEEPRPGNQPAATPMGTESLADRNEAIVADTASVGTDTRPVSSEVNALQPGS
jgi:sterol desaturase/sphingolipid hydroxylase (fatty acid hydroxylase superfamily)